MSSFKPTPEQELALTHPAPLLVLAGAGTGKTTVLTHRIAETIIRGTARPDQVLALTFTDKAATEMAERLSTVLGESGLPDAALEATVVTFHSFGGLVIRENLLRLSFDHSPAVLSNPSAWQLLTAIFDDLAFDAVEISTGQPGAVFSGLLHFFSQCRDHLVSPDDLFRWALAGDLPILSGASDAASADQKLASTAVEYMAKRRGEVRDVAAAYRRYEHAKRERCAIDFGDHLYLPVQLFREHLEVRESYQRRFPFVFVDEYQDTNHAQRELLLALLDPARPEIMVIGDDDQAIYRWRGAVVQNILGFPQESIFAQRQVKQVPMTLNRRSFPPILDLANLAISGVERRHEKKLRYHPDNELGQASVGYHVAATDRSEGDWIATRILELEPKARDYPGKKRGYGAIAILCRKRRLFAPVGQALERAGIPYELIGGTGFYDRWEIRDILSYLRVLANNADDVAVARVLRSRRWRLAGRELFHLSQWARSVNGHTGRNGDGRPESARQHLLDAVLNHEQVPGLSPEAQVRLGSLSKVLRGYTQAAHLLPLAALVSHVVEHSGYTRELRVLPGFDARVALLNLEKLEEMARQFGALNASAHLADFVELIRYALDSGEDENELRPIDQETNTVKVMTIHQAKGLEFPIIFIPGLAEKMFPTPGRDEADKWSELPWALRGDRDHLPVIDLTSVRTPSDLKQAIETRKEAEKAARLDEERRLFYVAITRAERQLYFSRAHWYGKTVNPRQASPFWGLVAESGLSQDLGEEQYPARNPNAALPEMIGEETNVGVERDGDIGALLLSIASLGRWIETTAEREGRGRWAELRAEADSHLDALGTAVTSAAEIEEPSISCSGLLLYLACPRHYRYRYVDSLPTRPSPAAALGSAVHRRIEELSRQPEVDSWVPSEQRAPDDDDEADDAGEALTELLDRAGQLTLPGHYSADDLVSRFRQSAYGRRAASYIEAPFRLLLERGSLNGRIDRLDRLPDGRWELVDFKSGVPSSDAAQVYRRQLALYTLAVRDAWDAPADRIAAHLFFLRDGSDIAFTFGNGDLDDLRQETEAALLAIARGNYPAQIGSTHCSHCDYQHLCIGH